MADQGFIWDPEPEEDRTLGCFLTAMLFVGLFVWLILKST